MASEDPLTMKMIRDLQEYAASKQYCWLRFTFAKIGHIQSWVAWIEMMGIPQSPDFTQGSQTLHDAVGRLHAQVFFIRRIIGTDPNASTVSYPPVDQRDYKIPFRFTEEAKIKRPNNPETQVYEGIAWRKVKSSSLRPGSSDVLLIRPASAGFSWVASRPRLRS